MSRTVKKPYTGSKKADKTCRNHGSCSYCERNRRIQELREQEKEAEVKKAIYEDKI